MIRTIALLLALSFPTLAHAHSWYDPYCCNDKDCHPVEDEDLEELPGGEWKHLPTGKVFSKDKVKPTQDRKQHVCIWNGQPRCIYIRFGT